jgi:hypothetical protein
MQPSTSLVVDYVTSARSPAQVPGWSCPGDRLEEEHGMDRHSSLARTFELRLEPWFFYLYEMYLHWLRQLVERLGRENTLRAWRGALENFDGSEQGMVLANNWRRLPEGSVIDIEGRLNELVAKYFAGTINHLTTREAQQLVEQTPPITAIRNRFSSLDYSCQLTAYDALLLFDDWLALLAESLIEQFGKKGEFMVYSIRLTEPRLCRERQISVQEFLNRRAAEFRSDPAVPTILSAGLEVQQTKITDSEIVQLVTHCEWARFYRSRHPRVGYLLSCATDHATYRQANDRLRLQRTATLMEGGEVCDFRIYVIDG